MPLSVGCMTRHGGAYPVRSSGWLSQYDSCLPSSASPAVWATCSTWSPSHGINMADYLPVMSMVWLWALEVASQHGRSWHVGMTLHLTSILPSCCVAVAGFTMPGNTVSRMYPPQSLTYCVRDKDGKGASQMGLNTMHYAASWTQHPLREGTEGRDSTALSLRNLSSGNGRDKQRNLTLRLWQGDSLQLSKAGPTGGGRKHLDRLPGEGTLLVLSLWRDSSGGARPLSRVAAAAVAGNPGMGPTM